MAVASEGLVGGSDQRSSQACAERPIHVPGAIQPHGMLFAIAQDTLRIDQVSENVSGTFGQSAAQLLGQEFGSLFSPASRARLSESLRAGLRGRLTLTLEALSGSQYEAQLHVPPAPAGLMVVELEPTLTEQADFHPLLRASLARLQSAAADARLWELATHELRALSGFDRVLLLLFNDDWSGRVVAESKLEPLVSLQGVAFPESEIPAPARSLYTRSWLRLVADVHATPAPLLPAEQAGPPLDLSFAHLRSVSPAHLEYLARHNVTASMSVSLVVDGKLRGLLAFRHYSGPYLVSRQARDAAELLGQLLSFQLHMQELRESSERALEERVRRADQAKEVFIANVSHELRTPLNAITGWTSMLQSGAVPSERIPHAIEVIARNARVQTQLVDDLIAVSGMSTGQLPLRPQPLDLAELVEEVLEGLRLNAATKLIRVDVELAPDCRVFGDSLRLKQVAQQLLANALKFTPRGGSVCVSLGRIGPDVQLCVADSGTGISDEFLPRVFAPFRQQEEGPARRQQGLGLGLSMVQQLVELHGGSVHAESGGPERGACFRVLLPALQ